MVMSPRLRKLALMAHVTSSVGWLGAVASFLVLAVAGLSSGNAQIVRGAYVVMSVIAWWIIVPACFASLITGLVSSLGTPWGLFRQYWVLLKLLVTVPATILLLVHMRPIDYMAGVAAGTTLANVDLHGLRVQLIIEAGAAMLVLLVATALSVYKPKGMTRYGWRKQHDERALARSEAT